MSAVSHSVDVCMQERRYDASRGMSLLVEDWVSRASALQRKGRAGSPTSIVMHTNTSSLAKALTCRMAARAGGYKMCSGPELVSWMQGGCALASALGCTHASDASSGCASTR